MNHIDIIQYCMSLYKNGRYLEVGVAEGDNFISVHANHKEGVDPISPSEQLSAIINGNNCLYFQMSSDEYFSKRESSRDQQLFDVVFVDGLHEHKQAFRDILNALEHTQDRGIVIVHDCLPSHEMAGLPPSELAKIDKTTRDTLETDWNGDVWKAIVQLRSSNREVRVFTLDCDYGCAIITKELPELPLSYDMESIIKMDFAYLQNNCDELLNLKSERYLFDFLQQYANRAYDTLYVEDVSRWRNVSLMDYRMKEDIGVTEVDDGIILPARAVFLHKEVYRYEGGVCDREGNFFAGYTRDRQDQAGYFSCSSGYAVDLSCVKKSDEMVIFCGLFYNHIGHFLLESLPRLWWAIDNPNSGYKFAFITNELHIRSQFMDFLAMLGIESDDVRLITEPTQFKKILIPDQAVYINKGFTDKWIGIYDRIRDSVSAERYEKVYLSRSLFEQQDTINESYYEEFFRKEGYEVVYPEQLTIERQVAVLAGAKKVACTRGTLGHLVLFCRTGVELVALNRTTAFIEKEGPLTQQCMINQARSVKCTFIDATWNILPSTHTGPAFLFYPTAQWKAFLADNNIVNDTVSKSIDDLIPTYIRRWAFGYMTGSFAQKSLLLGVSLSETAEGICKYLHPALSESEFKIGGQFLIVDYDLSKSKNAAIYGTGSAAAKIISDLSRYAHGDIGKIKCVIENDGYKTTNTFYNLPVRSLRQALDTDGIDTIIISSKMYGYKIYNRIKDQVGENVRLLF